ncbi:MAG: hypothetical protein M3P94_04365, partial [Chloroflexota bacterium]|nr:hypothetical protein [Chloroflexota bacterium]
LGKRLGGRPWVGAVAAGLVAIDPLSIQWDAHVRMYGLLQVLCLAIVWVFLGAVANPARWRWAAALAGLFCLATFTHVGAATLWPPLAGVALLVHGRGIWRGGRPLAMALGAAAVAPLVVSLLPAVIGPENFRDSGAGGSLLGFAGADLLAPERLTDPSIDAWLGLFGQRWASVFAPLVLVAATGYLLGRLGDPDRSSGSAGAAPGHGPGRVGLLTLLATYWGGVAAVSLFTTEQHPRYLLYLQPLGALLLALAAATVVGSGRVSGAESGVISSVRSGTRRGVGRRDQARSRQTTRLRPATLVAVAALVLPGLVASGMGVAWRLGNPTVDVDYVTALRYVADHRESGEPVIVALPPSAYLVLGSRRNLYFLAGTEGQARVTRYTRVTELGRTVDYWTGTTTVTDPGELCGLLRRRPGAWVVVDTPRLNAVWAYRGEMTATIRAMTEEVSRAPGGVRVLRALPEDELPACDALGDGPPAEPDPLAALKALATVAARATSEASDVPEASATPGASASPRAPPAT